MPATQDPAKGSGDDGRRLDRHCVARSGRRLQRTSVHLRDSPPAAWLRVTQGSATRVPVSISYTYDIRAREGFSIYIHTFGSWTGARIGTAHAVSLSGSEWSGLP